MLKHYQTYISDTVRRVTRSGVLFKVRLGKISYYYLELVGAIYLKRKK